MFPACSVIHGKLPSISSPRNQLKYRLKKEDIFIQENLGEVFSEVDKALF